MKKLIISTICIVGVLLSISFILLPNINKVSAQKEEFVSITDTQTPKTCKYIIKNFNGSLAVFENGKISPIRITDVDISSLPLVDQQLLQEGIMIENENDLSAMLEDYCS